MSIKQILGIHMLGGFDFFFFPERKQNSELLQSEYCISEIVRPKYMKIYLFYIFVSPLPKICIKSLGLEQNSQHNLSLKF